jgi:hypothetical protein
MRQSWKFFLEAPLVAPDLQIGFGKPSSALDQRRIDVESMLRTRSISVWLVDERYLSGAISEGRQVVYDEDGKYFRVAERTQSPDLDSVWTVSARGRFADPRGGKSKLSTCMWLADLARPSGVAFRFDLQAGVVAHGDGGCIPFRWLARS